MTTRDFLKSLAVPFLAPLIDLREADKPKPDPKRNPYIDNAYREAVERFEAWEWVDIEFCHCFPDGTYRTEKQRVWRERGPKYLFNSKWPDPDGSVCMICRGRLRPMHPVYIAGDEIR